MKDYTFNISLSILNHLGRNLYRNFITVLGEAISNSWDADAKNVWIYIDREKNTLIIKDDGDGMNENDFQTKFLKIGYSKRKEGDSKTKSGRPFIGRKGIGKLALLSCAETISISTKKGNTDYTGGTIDNSELTKAIDDDLMPKDYKLESLQLDLFKKLQENHTKGTIIYFENINDGIKNRVEYLRKLIALYFRFSLLDSSFNIILNDKPITLDEMSDLANSTQFLWRINEINDPYLNEKLAPSPELVRTIRYKSALQIEGFIASVIKPANLKIRQTDEKIGIDLFVNGRLREKDILKRIPSARVPESYLYGQIHFNSLDDEIDRFTSSREGVVSDDPLFIKLIQNIGSIVRMIIDDWDKWRVELRQEGDSENKRITKKERKSKELFDTISDEFIPPKTSPNRNKVEDWINKLSNDAQFNFTSYSECFVSENLLRRYINDKPIVFSKEAEEEIKKWKDAEIRNKGKANLSIKLRQNNDDLSYLSMDGLANLTDKVDPIRSAGLSRDAKEYKPIRDALSHTALLTDLAKNRLSSTYENIKARIKKLLE